MSNAVLDVATQPYPDQQPGTSGLRKKVSVFKQPNYIQNFIQSILEAAKPSSLVVGGDGRYFSEEAIAEIITICSANDVNKLLVARNGLLSTPAASAAIRGHKTDGGIILTASHNPGGENGDFGIKYNTKDGGPAPEHLTNKIYEISKSLGSYKSLFKRTTVDLNKQDLHEVKIGNMNVEIIDPVEIYVNQLRSNIDFDVIKQLFKPAEGKKPFKMIVDSMHGVNGLYAKRILHEELGAPLDSLINSEPKPDFGGHHPDPNLTYAKSLVDKLKADQDIDFGVAFDGDGDRNMILGKGAFFVTPGDSLAIIGAHLKHFKRFQTVDTVKGFARSFPTAPAIDRVAEKMGLKCYETPTGWKFFVNLMEGGPSDPSADPNPKALISLCGEESFGTGSVHVREKDGLWTCLAWLFIMAKTGKTVKELVEDHWKEYGRDYFCRYDFEECNTARCLHMIKELQALFDSKSLIGRSFGIKDRYKAVETGNFQYTDPVDNSVTKNQGLYIKFEGGAKVIIRLSGTASSSSTVRLYVTEHAKENYLEESSEYLADLCSVALQIMNIGEYTGKTEPTVIT